MNSITVTFTEAEWKALNYIVLDPSEWILTIAKNLAKNAMDEIYMNEVSRLTEQGSNIDRLDKNDIVLQADVQTFKDRQKVQSDLSQ